MREKAREHICRVRGKARDQVCAREGEGERAGLCFEGGERAGKRVCVLTMRVPF